MQWLYTSFEPRLSGFLSNSIGEKYSLKLQDKIQKPTLVIYYSTKYVGRGGENVAVGLGMRLEWCSGNVAVGLGMRLEWCSGNVAVGLGMRLEWCSGNVAVGLGMRLEWCSGNVAVGLMFMKK